jgi:transcriptional regulator with XRE-family HTH domain
MTDIVPQDAADPPALGGLKGLDPTLGPEVRAWVRELRTVWAQVGMSQNRFARTYHLDKGTVSRYLSGRRIPGDDSFLDRLLAIKAEQGMDVSPQVRDHLTGLQLAALQVTHPHEYRVRLVRDKLHVAVVGQREAERYAAHLEGRLAERIRQHDRLKATWEADRAALQAERDHLEAEIGNLTSQLDHAHRRASEAEQRCQKLEELLNRLETFQSSFDDVLPIESQTYVKLEESAALIRTYVQSIPALLQSEGYARALIRLGNARAAEHEIDQRVEQRLQRQERLTGPDAPRLWAVVDEGALRRPVGGPEVMRGQFEHLIEMSKLPNVTIQIMPFWSGIAAAEGGAFTVLRFPVHDAPDVVYVENLTGAMYLDKRDDVDTHLQAMERLCVDSATPERTVDLLCDLLRKV